LGGAATGAAATAVGGADLEGEAHHDESREDGAARLEHTGDDESHAIIG